MEDADYKRAGNFIMINEENIVGFEALYTSMLKCKNDVMWKDSVAHFVMNGIEECLRLEKELKEGSYKPRQTHKVHITHPKPREAVSIAFRDRVYQRSLNDNELYPAMTKSFIYANVACQRGKGPDVGRNLLDKYLHRAYRKHGFNFYVLQGDIKGYYKNIVHVHAEGQIAKHCKEHVAARAKAVLNTQYSGASGYNPGSQMVQIVGISHLDPLDHFIKEQLRIKYYIRYQDDFLLLHPDKEYLTCCLRKIQQQLDLLQLQTHPKKTLIYHVSHGIPFLGFTHFLTSSGHTYRIVDSKGAKAYRKKLARMVNLVKKGRMSKEKLLECYRARLAHVDKGNSARHKKRMDRYLADLLKGAEL